MNTLMKGQDIVRCTESQKLRLLRHVERMEDNATLKRMIKGNCIPKEEKEDPR
jgi:hypothetical protein